MKKLTESDWTSGPQFIRAKEVVIPGNKQVSEMKTTELFRQDMKQSKSLSTRHTSPVLNNDVMDGYVWNEMVRGSTSSDPTSTLVMDLQRQVFPDGLETMNLESQNILPSNQRKLIAMTPFMDEEGLIRAGGRLARADLTFGR